MPEDLRGQLAEARASLDYMFAGHACVTLRSLKTGTRYTYKISQAEDRPTRYFVSLLNGPDNVGDFVYIGLVDDGAFRLTAKSAMKWDSPPVKAFEWTLKKLRAGAFPENLEIWHEGSCGRCGRKLTVPESVHSGFGPECAKIRKGAA